MKVTLAVCFALVIIAYLVLFAFYTRKADECDRQQRLVLLAARRVQLAGDAIGLLRHQHMADSTQHVRDSLTIAGYETAHKLGLRRQPVVVLN